MLYRDRYLCFTVRSPKYYQHLINMLIFTDLQIVILIKGPNVTTKALQIDIKKTAN